MSGEPGDVMKVVEGQAFQILTLQARCDALAAVVRMLAGRLGADTAKFPEGLEIIVETCRQLRLEKVEDRSPTLAARLDQRGPFVQLDPDLLDLFHFPTDS